MNKTIGALPSMMVMTFLWLTEVAIRIGLIITVDRYYNLHTPSEFVIALLITAFPMWLLDMAWIKIIAQTYDYLNSHANE